MPGLRFLLECSNLQHASPSVVGQCGVLHVPSDVVPWQMLIEPQMAALQQLKSDLVQMVREVVQEVALAGAAVQALMH